MTLTVTLLWIATILWLLAAIPFPSNPISLGWLGLFFFGLHLLFGK